MKSLNKYVIGLVVAVVTVTSASAFGIVSFRWLTREETPLLSAAMTEQRAAYVAQTGNRPPEQDDPLNVRHFNLNFDTNSDAVLEELKKFPALVRDFNSTNDLVLAEFERLKRNIRSRGYELSQDPQAELPKKLYVTYTRHSPAGPQFWQAMNGDPAHYAHSMQFEYWLSYQRRGHTLQDGETYPRLVLSGYVFFACREPFADCQVTASSFEEAAIRIEQMPGYRDGGNSSSGGGGR